MSNHINEIMLIGAGKMAEEYAKVLLDMQITFIVIGRGEESAKRFYISTGITPEIGGLKNWLDQNPKIPKTAIIAVNVEELANSTISLLEKGVKRILVEKPGGINIDEIRKIAKLTRENHAEVYIALNRRFYQSTIEGKELIKKDGGVTSFSFEFTEWSHVIENNNKINSNVKKNWFLANSSHVVDMAFFLGGKPQQMSCYKSGRLNWHPAASIFSGAGISDSGALFSYQANWEAPGSWRIEILTPKHRLIYNPLEQLHLQKRGPNSIEKLDINDNLDINFKPGLYKMTDSFLKYKNIESLVSVNEWFNSVSKFLKIAY